MCPLTKESTVHGQKSGRHYEGIYGLAKQQPFRKGEIEELYLAAELKLV